MTTSTVEMETPIASAARVEAQVLHVEIADGRQLTVPLSWYPRLLHASEVERNTFELIGDGTGIHWPDVEEDISIASMVAGRRSQESERPLQRWLANRRS